MNELLETTCRRAVRVREDLFARYLELSPVAHAVFRGSELQPLRGTMIEPPVIDIGCGTGEFALAALDGYVDVGIDNSRSRLGIARETGCYLRLMRTDAADIRYASGTFNSAIAISTFEHLRNPELVLHEIHRILLPKGRLVASILLDDVTRHLRLSKCLIAIGLPTLASCYSRFLHRIFDHRTLWSRHEWEHLLDKAGFTIECGTLTVPPVVIACWERHLALAWPYRLLPRASRSWLSRPGSRRAQLVGRFSDIVGDSGNDGCCLLVTVQKK